MDMLSSMIRVDSTECASWATQRSPVACVICLGWLGSVIIYFASTIRSLYTNWWTCMCGMHVLIYYKQKLFDSHLNTPTKLYDDMNNNIVRRGIAELKKKNKRYCEPLN